MRGLLFFLLLSLSIVSFSQDSLWVNFNNFETHLQNLPLDTSKHYPTKYENFELVWIRNVAHSHAEIQIGDNSLYSKDSMLSYRKLSGFSTWDRELGRGYFYGDDYFVITFGYNWNMSTIFNDTYYYKRKQITTIEQMYKTGGIEYGEPTGPISSPQLNYSIFNGQIDSVLRQEYNSYVDSVSMVPVLTEIDSGAYYKLRYSSGVSSGFDLYAGNRNYEFLYGGNEVVLAFNKLQKLIQSSGYSWFSSWSSHGKVLKFVGQISRHGGTFDEEGQYVFYFEKVE